MTELGRSQWPGRLVLRFQLKLLRPGDAGSGPRTWLRGAMAQGRGEDRGFSARLCEWDPKELRDGESASFPVPRFVFW